METAFNPSIPVVKTDFDFSKKSRIEIITRKYLDFYFKEWAVLYNYRPDFLRNHKTGKNLELDIYYPDLQFAVEVNGIQHKTKEGQRRDRIKFYSCRDNNIELFFIWNKHQILRLRDHIRTFFYSLPEFDGVDFRIHNEKLPFALYREILDYKPNKSAFGNLHSRIKKQIHREKISETQAEETERIRKIREIRGY